jgi:hypothetical protein
MAGSVSKRDLFQDDIYRLAYSRDILCSIPEKHNTYGSFMVGENPFSEITIFC